MTTNELAEFLDKNLSVTFRMNPNGFPTSVQLRGFSEDKEAVDQFITMHGKKANGKDRIYLIEKDYQGRRTFWINGQGPVVYDIAEKMWPYCHELKRPLQIVNEFLATRKDLKMKNSKFVNMNWRGEKRMELLAELKAINRDLWSKRNTELKKLSTK